MKITKNELKLIIKEVIEESRIVEESEEKLTKASIKNKITELGYKGSVRKHKMIDNAVSVFIKELGIGTADTFSKKLREANVEIFDYVNSLKGKKLSTGEKLV
jgi:hypothetical protein